MKPDVRPVFLVGFMGSGKSTLGRLMSRELRWSFLDTDDLVEREEGRTIERVFRDSGEDYFREIESRVLRSIRGVLETVVSTGGGSFLGFDGRQTMKRAGTTLWVDVPLEVIRDRLGVKTGDRPLWQAGDPVDLRAQFDRRAAVYALAHRRVRGWPGTPEQVVQRALARLAGTV